MIMTKRLSLFLIGCICVFAMLRAQKQPACRELFLESSVGGAFHVTPEQSINPWLCLNNYSKSDAIVTLGAKFFWSKAWGAQLRVLWNPATLGYLYDGYTDDGTVLDNQHVIVSRDRLVGNVAVGLVYRSCFGRWRVQPYFNIGITKFSEACFSSYIRHLGTNDVDSFFLKMKRKNNISFSLLPGLHIAYRLEENVCVYADVSYAMHSGTAVGEYTLNNLYTQELRERQSFKDKHANALLLGVGVSAKFF